MACFWKTTQLVFHVVVPSHVKNKLNESFLKFILVALNNKKRSTEQFAVNYMHLLLGTA